MKYLIIIALILFLLFNSTIALGHHHETKSFRTIVSGSGIRLLGANNSKNGAWGALTFVYKFSDRYNIEMEATYGKCGSKEKNYDHAILQATAINLRYDLDYKYNPYLIFGAGALRWRLKKTGGNTAGNLTPYLLNFGAGISQPISSNLDIESSLRFQKYIKGGDLDLNILGGTEKNSGLIELRVGLSFLWGNRGLKDSVETAANYQHYNLQEAFCYPNPAPTEEYGNYVYFGFNLTEPSDVSIEIYDPTGEIIETIGTFYRDKGRYTNDADFRWNISGIPSDIYIFKIISESKTTGKTEFVFKKLKILQ